MIAMKSAGIAGLVTVCLMACNTAPAPETKAPVDEAALKAEIQAMEDAYAAAEKAKDAAAVVAYYSDDATSYSNNQDPFVGKAAIQAAVAERLAKDTTGYTREYSIIDLYHDGDLLVEVGKGVSRKPDGTEDGKPSHYISVFKKQADGKYRCVRDMSITTNPAKE